MAVCRVKVAIVICPLVFRLAGVIPASKLVLDLRPAEQLLLVRLSCASASQVFTSLSQSKLFPALISKMSSYSVLDRYIYKTRPLRIVIVGAGLTGIAAVYKLDHKFKDLDITYQIYEKNHDVGGTWLENRYPGCACDVPAHSVSSLLPNPVRPTL